MVSWIFTSPPQTPIPLLWEEGRARDWRTNRKSGTVLCMQQAAHWHLAVVVTLPNTQPRSGRHSGLASAEEYPEEYLDSSSPSLEEEDRQFRRVPVQCSCKRQGEKHARGLQDLGSPQTRLILQIREQHGSSKSSKPATLGRGHAPKSCTCMKRLGREGTREGTKRSTLLPKSLLKGCDCQGEHSPVRVEGHQTFIRTLTKSSIALVKLH